MHTSLVPLRGPALLCALPLGLAGCFGEEATGTVTDVYTTAVVYGIVQGPNGEPAAGVPIESFQYPIDRTTLEGGDCIGVLQPGPMTTSGSTGRYRLVLNGFVGQVGSGCVQIVASPDETMAAAPVTVEQRGVPYTPTTRDSTRIDVVLPAAE